MKPFFIALSGASGALVSAPISNAATTDLVLVFDGNSLTEGITHAGIDQYYPKQVNANYEGVFKSKTFYSYGVGGQTTKDMLSDVVSQIYPKVEAGKTNILIAWEDANSLFEVSGSTQYGQSTAQENFNDFVTYFQGAKDAGFDICILLTGYLPRKSANGNYEIGSSTITPTSVDKMESYCNLVANANISSVPWDYHIDLRNAPNIGGPKGQLKDPTYFGDYLHLYAAGYDIIAQQVIAQINEIFGI